MQGIHGKTVYSHSLNIRFYVEGCYQYDYFMFQQPVYFTSWKSKPKVWKKLSYLFESVDRKHLFNFLFIPGRVRSGF